jgi:hypothetical protein
MKSRNSKESMEKAKEEIQEIQYKSNPLKAQIGLYKK